MRSRCLWPYAGLAGLPPQIGIYGYLLGGLGYALLGVSRQLAVGPTFPISLMIAGTVGASRARMLNQLHDELAPFAIALRILGVRASSRPAAGRRHRG